MKSYCGFLRSPHFTVYVSSSARSRAPACQFCKKPLCSLEIATKSRSSPNSLSVNPLAPLLLPSPSRVPPPPPPPLHSSLRLPPPHPCVFSTASDAPRRRLSNAPPPGSSPSSPFPAVALPGLSQWWQLDPVPPSTFAPYDIRPAA
jgi:hypothetical protein